MAAKWREVDIVSLLLAHGADPNMANDRRRTPLLKAAEWGKVDNVSLLLLNGADPNIADDSGQRPRDVARDDKTRNIFDQFDSLVENQKIYEERVREALPAPEAHLNELSDEEAKDLVFLIKGLPYEIWGKISGYLDLADLPAFSEVSRGFFRSFVNQIRLFPIHKIIAIWRRIAPDSSPSLMTGEDHFSETEVSP